MAAEKKVLVHVVVSYDTAKVKYKAQPNVNQYLYH